MSWYPNPKLLWIRPKRQNYWSRNADMSRFSKAQEAVKILETLSKGARKKPRISAKVVRKTIGALDFLRNSCETTVHSGLSYSKHKYELYDAHRRVFWLGCRF